MKHTLSVLDEIYAERVRQEARYGHVNDLLVDGTGPGVAWIPWEQYRADAIQKGFRVDYEAHEEIHGNPTWMHLVREEIAEAFQETDPARLQEELLQVAALCVSWVERIRSRHA